MDLVEITLLHAELPAHIPVSRYRRLRSSPDEAWVKEESIAPILRSFFAIGILDDEQKTILQENPTSACDATDSMSSYYVSKENIDTMVSEAMSQARGKGEENCTRYSHIANVIKYFLKHGTLVLSQSTDELINTLIEPVGGIQLLNTSESGPVQIPSTSLIRLLSTVGDKLTEAEIDRVYERLDLKPDDPEMLNEDDLVDLLKVE